MNEVDQPSWIEVIRRALDRRQQQIHTALPGQIVEYDTERTGPQLATVQLMLQEERPGDEFETIPPLEGVPIAFPHGGGYSMTFPLAPGDAGVVIFYEADPSQWRTTGEISRPSLLLRHGLYASLLPCEPRDGHLLEAIPGKMVIGKRGDGQPRIIIDDTLVQLAGTGGEFVALANLVTDALTALKNAISSAPVVALDGGAAFKAGILGALSTWPPSVAATKTKAE